LSPTNQGFGFYQVFRFAKVSIFSGGYFLSFCFSKIGSCSLFKKFRVKSAQVPKISINIFRQSFGKQVVSFGKVCFLGLRSFGQSQVFKIGIKVLAKVFVKSGQAFLSGSFFLAK